jgi:hypothetical protein
MGILSWLTKETVSGVAGAAVDVVGGLANVIDKFVETDDEKRVAELIKMRMIQRPAEAQIELNKIEAGSRSTFVAGWRPAIGWVGAISLASFYIPQFVLASIMWVKVSWAASTLAPYPVTEINGLMELVLTMLGMGMLRTYEKKEGLTK